MSSMCMNCRFIKTLLIQVRVRGLEQWWCKRCIKHHAET